MIKNVLSYKFGFILIKVDAMFGHVRQRRGIVTATESVILITEGQFKGILQHSFLLKFPLLGKYSC